MSTTSTTINEGKESSDWSIDDLFSNNSDKTVADGDTISQQQPYESKSSTQHMNYEITPELYARIPHTMIFANDVENVKALTKRLNSYGLKALEFHKQLLPSLKEMYLQLFKEGIINIYLITVVKYIIIYDSANLFRL